MKNIMLFIALTALTFAGCQKEKTKTEIIARAWTVNYAEVNDTPYPDLINSNLDLKEGGAFTFYLSNANITGTGVWYLLNSDTKLRLRYANNDLEEYTVLQLTEDVLKLKGNTSDANGNPITVELNLD